MRYVGELCKFRLFPHGAAFSLLKVLLDDFQGHNIDAACALVETAGRFLFRCGAVCTVHSWGADGELLGRGGRLGHIIDTACAPVETAGRYFSGVRAAPTARAQLGAQLGGCAEKGAIPAPSSTPPQPPTGTRRRAPAWATFWR